MQTGAILVDGLGVGDVGNIVLRDRQHLAEDGILIVVLTLAKGTNQLLAGPDIVSRGFVYVRESEGLMEEAKEVLNVALEGCLNSRNADWSKIKIVEGMDLLTYYLRTTIQDQYVGRYANTYDNKCVLVTAIQTFLAELEGQGVLSSGESWAEIDVEAQEKWMRSQGIETADMTAQEIREYQTGSWVFVRVGGRFVDAMEDFQLSVDNL